ncbi:hypothetical protein PARPLA_01261 [Rhodobacteraceae bacterium THAF1]|nr:hypothetical protein FIU81_00875 [Palleronia sp. THAF1]VDC20898.1 hypothetical protein PARPLA_01261 [Rhodobacteraceae bacterium THAF1]
MSKTTNKCFAEVRERAVWMVPERGIEQQVVGGMYRPEPHSIGRCTSVGRLRHR